MQWKTWESILPKVAVLTANEMVDPKKYPSTMDAAGLVGSSQKQKTVFSSLYLAEGPIAFDVAFDPQAAAHKKIDSKINRMMDLVIFP